LSITKTPRHGLGQADVRAHNRRKKSVLSDSDCVEFLQWALPRLNLRWPGFRKVRGQVCKRIRRRMQTLGLPDFVAYRVHIERESAEWTILDSFCRITISRFYRDKAVFRAIDNIVLPDLAARAAEEKRGLRCWAIGCASGEEVYTLRILWDCAITGTRSDVGFSVLGTDVDDSVLRRASAGCYAARQFERPTGRIDREML
jgi:chemotaxis protein methyltransferase CheR